MPIFAERPEATARICEWLTAHDVDLSTIPAEVPVRLDAGPSGEWPGYATVDQFVYDSRGRQMDRRPLRVPMTEDERDRIVRAAGG